MIQLMDHMKHKRKKDQRLDASVLLRRGNNIMKASRKVPDARKARESQDIMGMTLAEITTEGEPVETISRG